MTCCSGSPVSSASETTKVADASFSSSSMDGSAATSFSNWSSGMSGRTFLPSGPTATSAVFSATTSTTSSSAGAAAFLAVAAFLAGAAAFLAAAVFVVPLVSAFLAGAFLVAAVAVFLVVVAAATRASLTSTCTEMPSVLRCASSPLRWRGSTWASSLARRTSSGLRLPLAPFSTRATTAGWLSTCSGTLRAFEEDTNTSSIMAGWNRSGAGCENRLRARPDPLSSRAASLILPRGPRRSRIATAPEGVFGSRVDDVRRGAALRWSGAEGQPPVLAGLAVDVEHPLVALPGLERQWTDLEGEREVDVRTVSQPCRSSDLGLGGDLHRVRTLRARDADRLPVLADQAQPELEPLVGPVPRHVELDRDGRRSSPARHAPAAAVDVELSLGNHGVVGEQHRGPHVRPPAPWPRPARRTARWLPARSRTYPVTCDHW